MQPQELAQLEEALLVEPTRSRSSRRLPPFVVAAVVLLATLIVGSIVAPQFLPDPSYVDLGATLRGPGYHAAGGSLHILGTDDLGRDELSRALIGLRTSLEIALLATLVGAAVGTALGMVAGYLGGVVDDLLMRLVDIQMSVPGILLIVTVVAIAKPGFLVIVLVLGISVWMVFARVARAQILSLKEQDMVLAIRSLGASNRRTLIRHVLPNIAPALLVIGTLQIANLIVAEASLEYLGLGVPAPNPTLGSMISTGQGVLTTGAWWPVVVPGGAVVVVIIGITILGDWIRDQMDPRVVARR
jgi:peptide/nickel transport system permease protein